MRQWEWRGCVRKPEDARAWAPHSKTSWNNPHPVTEMRLLALHFILEMLLFTAACTFILRQADGNDCISSSKGGTNFIHLGQTTVQIVLPTQTEFTWRQVFRKKQPKIKSETMRYPQLEEASPDKSDSGSHMCLPNRPRQCVGYETQSGFLWHVGSCDLTLIS